MTELEIRPARQADLEYMLALDHHSLSAYAYKMEVKDEKDEYKRNFQRVHLPRQVTLNYPKDEAALLAAWDEAKVIFVGCSSGVVVAYIALELGRIKDSVRVSDFVVAPRMRRKGIGSHMLLSCEGWAHEQGAYRLLTELQVRNDPAINLVMKLGYQLCGYLDQYFPNKETALFFEKWV